ncbi:MAG: chromosome segregation protein ScpA [Planctomycetota bacterium]|nr:MAG: chromosome segregation protein ScpA [Planctomycetota bacterium]
MRHRRRRRLNLSAEYRVQLDVFSGPLDLLLYLIRRDEVDIQDVQIARVAEQYLEYVRLLEQVDPNAAGDFLVMASTLIELKSRALLPSPPIESLDDEDDPRAQLVRQLLEYKRFKDAARTLGSAADERARRYVRRPADLPKELAGVELEEAQVWDLLQAFGKVMTAIGRGPAVHEIEFDDTPIEHYAASIVDALKIDGPCTFQSLFSGRSSRAEVVGLLLALLELIRNRCVRAEQEKEFGTIYLFLLEEVDEREEFEEPSASADHDAEDAEHDAVESSGAPSPPQIVSRDERDVIPHHEPERKQHEQAE